MLTLKLKQKEEHRIKNGHYWIFSNELEKVDTSIKPGTIVRFESARGEILGTGFFNPHSLISGRLIVKGDAELSKNFIFEFLDNAYTFSKVLGLR